MKRLFLTAVLSLTACQMCAAQQVSSNMRSLLSSQGKALYGDEPNSIVVIDYPENIQQIEEYLASIDVPPQQVFIEARVVEVNLGKEQSLGINWSLFGNKGGLDLKRTFNLPSDITISGASQNSAISQNIAVPKVNSPALSSNAAGTNEPFTLTIFDENINVVLKTLATQLDTEILSAPRVSTVNNRPAEIKVTQKLPWAEPTVTLTDNNQAISWKINFEEVGITLRVTPTINDDGNITMVLNPDVSEKVSDYELHVKQIQGDVTLDVPYTVPVIDSRTADTKVVIGNGQTLIIGGLIKDRSIKQETKVPVLGDLPFLGVFFKNTKKVKDKSELLIFVSPTIINSKVITRMTKEERYGIGRNTCTEVNKEHQRMILTNEHNEELRKQELEQKIDRLSQKQQNLAGERVKLEQAVRKEEQDLRSLENR
ncbi:MAG: type II secretion system protein GspD [Deltaproteobacteria bacterium]